MLDLAKFCSIDAARPSITTPWNDGEYALATCGRLIIRVPRQDGLEERVAGGVNRPDYRNIIKVKEQAEYTSEWPLIAEKEQTCTECDGSGTDQIVCGDCGGKGFYGCPHCGQDMDCEECDGTGKVGDPKKPCPECKGAKMFKYTLHQIGDNHFTSLLLDLIKDLPGIAIEKSGRMHPTHFKFDGGDGIIMPTAEYQNTTGGRNHD